MPNELESARKKRERTQRRQAFKANPVEAMRSLYVKAAPLFLEQSLQALEEEIIQAERDQKRRRDRMKLLLELSEAMPHLLELLGGPKAPSPSA